MIDYDTYNNIISYLDKNQLSELREYLEKEKNNFYLENARISLTKYLKKDEKSFYDYLDSKRIIFSNSISVYILNSDEILTRYRINKLSQISHEEINKKIEILLRGFEKYENMPSTVVSYITRRYSAFPMYSIYTKDKKVIYDFDKANFDYSINFLGENINYNICDSFPVCLAKSDKGKGLILGLRRK